MKHSLTGSTIGVKLKLLNRIQEACCCRLGTQPEEPYNPKPNRQNLLAWASGFESLSSKNASLQQVDTAAVVMTC